jgi:hypothetical protein
MAQNHTPQPSASSPQPLDVLREVICGLETLGIAYMVTGSFASSLHGFARSTQDADIIVKFGPEHVEGFIEQFRQEFYVDRALIEQALQRGTSFNVIHLRLMFKVDFFILQNRSFNQKEFSRRVRYQLGSDPTVEGFWQTAEDTLLSKLEWYRAGGEISEYQWRDLMGIIKNRREQLDLAYLNQWAPELRVDDLLEKALKEARS